MNINEKIPNFFAFTIPFDFAIQGWALASLCMCIIWTHRINFDVCPCTMADQSDMLDKPNATK